MTAKKSPPRPRQGEKGSTDKKCLPEVSLGGGPYERKQGGLGDTHHHELHASALTDNAIALLQWSTDHNGGLLIPYLRPDGSPETCHDGKPFARKKPAWSAAQLATSPPKYISPEGEGCRLYHSHLAIAGGGYCERIGNIHVPLRITEGEKKTEAATLHDPKCVTVGIGGISSWKDRYDGGESRPLVDWDEIPLDGRTVIICPDSDVRKPAVRAATRGLAELLQGKGAYVMIERLPNDLNGDRLGLDDLVYRYGAGYLKQITELAHPAFVMSGRGKNAELVFHLPDEPEGKSAAHERGVYLVGMVGHHWRQSSAGEKFWHQWTGTHWTEHSGHDAVEAVIETFLDAQDWKCREGRIVRDMRGSLRRSVGDLPPNPTPGLIPFSNGCLRLTDHALIEHRQTTATDGACPSSGSQRPTAKLLTHGSSIDWVIPTPWQCSGRSCAQSCWVNPRRRSWNWWGRATAGRRSPPTSPALLSALPTPQHQSWSDWRTTRNGSRRRSFAARGWPCSARPAATAGPWKSSRP